MADRIDELIVNAGLPEVLAGFSTIMVGDTITEFTNTRPLDPSLHEAVGLGVSAIVSIAMMGLAAEVKRKVRQVRQTKNT